jgi:dihydroorotase (multifunctional complex type)
LEHDLVLEGRVVTPRGFEDLEVGVDDGKIVEMKHQGLKGARRIRTGRGLTFPGFIDVHVHLREPGWEYKEDFRSGSEAAVHGGVTTVADMPNNRTPATNPTLLMEKRRLADEKALVDVRLYGGVQAGRLADLKEMAPLVAGYKLYLARSTGGAIFPETELRAFFREASQTGLPASLHCEDQTIIERMEAVLSGQRRADLYCDIRPPQAEVSSVRKVIEALRGFGGMRANICHVSTAETLAEVRRARESGLLVECEAALHHIFFNRKAALEDGLLRTNPPLRPESDRRALLEGLKSGLVSFLVTDHAPHTEEEKRSQGLAGVPGLDDYAHIVSWLIREQGVSPDVIARVASSSPAKFLGLDDRGEVAVGKRADLTVVDIHTPVKASRDQVRSKCGWSPYEGMVFPGGARWTIGEGTVLLDDGDLVT